MCRVVSSTPSRAAWEPSLFDEGPPVRCAGDRVVQGGGHIQVLPTAPPEQQLSYSYQEGVFAQALGPTSLLVQTGSPQGAAGEPSGGKL